MSRRRHEDIYGSDWPARSRACKRAAGWRCQLCGRPQRQSWWRLWQPRTLNAHHWHRRLDSELLCVCRFCHMAVIHAWDRLSPLPLAADTWLALHAGRVAVAVTRVLARVTVAVTRVLALPLAALTLVLALSHLYR